MFFRRRTSTSIICWISRSRPNTGSTSPRRAFSVRSMAKRESASPSVERCAAFPASGRSVARRGRLAVACIGFINRRMRLVLARLTPETRQQAFDLRARQREERPRVLRSHDVRRGDDGLQQMRRADRPVDVRARRDVPCVLQHARQLQRQRGHATQIARQTIDGGKQRVPDGVDVQFVVAQDCRKVSVTRLDQLQQPVLDGDFVAQARLAQARGGFERAGAVRVEPAKQMSGVTQSHIGQAKRQRKAGQAQKRSNSMVRPACLRGLAREPVRSVRPKRFGCELRCCYERSFQVSAWMMLPSLYAQVIFS